MRQLVLSLLIVSMSITTWAQGNWWVVLSDKGAEASCQLADPAQFLSPASLALRAEKNIGITSADLPVDPTYVAAIQDLGYKVQSTSRWLNAVAIQTTVPPQELNDLPFVKQIYPCAKLTLTAVDEETSSPEKMTPLDNEQDYGRGYNQAEMLEIPAYHAQGFTGEGVRVAILDGGFPGVDEMDAFAHLREQNRILATYDFVDDTSFVYYSSSHGTQVLSTIATHLPGEMIGTAPDVSVILCRTEDTGSERQIEEYNFMEAVEFADSVGVDIIHASLGYTEFDVDAESYTYEDLNGDKAITTRAVDWAAQRGIIFTISAGNEGGSAWRHIAAPCDADSGLCVGAVNRDGKLTYFSSVGPTADGRIKPDVVAQGGGTTVVAPNGRVTTSNGTSFSGPIMAGFVACLKQAHPDRSNVDIIQAVRLSGDQAGSPDVEYGYGIPNALKADSLLGNVENLAEVEMVMADKPDRDAKRPKTGRIPQERKKIEMTANPKSILLQAGSKVTLKVPDPATIRSVQVMQGYRKVTLSPKDLKIKATSAKIKTKYLVPGEYYLDIITNEYEEKVPFNVE